MQGVPDLDLAAGEYTITPSEAQRNWDERVGDVLSGDVEDGEEFHAYDVVDATGDAVLAVVERTVRLGDEDDFAQRVEWHHDFRSLEGDTAMTLDESQTLYGPDGSLLAQWERSLPLLGNWKLLGPDGEHRGTVTRDGFLARLVPRSAHGSYTVRAPTGGELATFDHSGAERSLAEGSLAEASLAETPLSKMTVTVSTAAIPPEVLVALGFSTQQRAQGAKAGSPPGAAGP